jgi:tetratricopeptide (TPR) repeat protein
MTKLQILVISLSSILVLGLYFGFDTKSSLEKKELREIEGSGINIDPKPLIEAAKKELSSYDLNELTGLENQADQAEGPERSVALQKLSGKWYRLNKPYIAGSYAEQVALEEPSGEAWSIAATTYLAGIGQAEDLLSKGCLNKAIEALENAISLEPEQIQHRLNLALVYAERPPEDNPMKGIQMLLSLNEKNPNSVSVLNALGRLAIKTGQWDRAQQRLEKADSLEPDNRTTICLLSEVYAQQQHPRAKAIKDKCELLTLKE